MTCVAGSVFRCTSFEQIQWLGYLDAKVHRIWIHLYLHLHSVQGLSVLVRVQFNDIIVVPHGLG